MSWLTSYSEAAALTDNFRDRPDHLTLLAEGLLGETGSIVTELKKIQREAEAYPTYRQRMTEEIGDFLWYFIRLAAVGDSALLTHLKPLSSTQSVGCADPNAALDLGAAVGAVMGLVRDAQFDQFEMTLRSVWEKFVLVAAFAGVNLEEAAERNLAKIRSRWPVQKAFHGLFDDGFPIEEQIPRRLTIKFIERKTRNGTLVLLRCNDIGIGDRITDNINDADGYRFHDIFHMSYAVFLGWSPIVRSLLRCKRKSNPTVDENQDGARAGIVEEAVSAIVFSRAKQMRFFDGAKQVDYDLLKSIQDFVRGFEVEQVPVWQWETAILQGYRVFRSLYARHGGHVTWDLKQRTLEWFPSADNKKGANRK